MKQKIIITLALIYSTQFILSCCSDQTYQNTITGVELVPLVYNGNSYSEIASSDTIDKEALFLGVDIQGTLEVGTMMKDLEKVEFSSSYAFIRCDDYLINYVNRIVGLKCFVIDESNNSEIEVTNNLVLEGGGSVSEYVESGYITADEDFLMTFSTTANLPSQARFRVVLLIG